MKRWLITQDNDFYKQGEKVSCHDTVDASLFGGDCKEKQWDNSTAKGEWF